MVVTESGHQLLMFCSVTVQKQMFGSARGHFISKNEWGQVWGLTLVILVLGRLRWEDCQNSETNLGYIRKIIMTSSPGAPKSSSETCLRVVLMIKWPVHTRGWSGGRGTQLFITSASLTSHWLEMFGYSHHHRPFSTWQGAGCKSIKCPEKGH